MNSGSKVTKPKRFTHSQFLHGDPQQRKLFLLELLNDPVQTGFLLAFCEAHYCTESLRFLVAIGRFYDHFNSRRDGIYTKEIRQFIAKDLVYITNTFLVDSAPYQICLSSDVMALTLEKMKDYEKYNTHIFDEACVDPTNTLVKDILPRFVLAPIFLVMNWYTDALYKLPSPDDLVFTPVHEVTFDELVDRMQLRTKDGIRLATEEDIRQYCSTNIQWYFNDSMLFAQFLKYLRRIRSSENLLCVKLIDEYLAGYDQNVRIEMSLQAQVQPDFGTKASMYSFGSDIKLPDNVFVNEQAWIVYMYFITPGAPFEIGLSKIERDKISRAMGRPTREIFDLARSVSMKILIQEHFPSFRMTTTPCFAQLLKDVTDRQQRMSVKRNERSSCW